jgi:two-component system response regulator
MSEIHIPHPYDAYSRNHAEHGAADDASLEIVLVEDNSGDSRILEMVLTEQLAGCRVRVIPDGEEARELIRLGPEFFGFPDLILMDLNLPKVSGIDLLAELHNHEALSRIPRIVVSSTQSENELSRSRALGVIACFRKPMMIEGYDLLIDLIKQHCVPASGVA